jgi:DNA-binding transcriptional LysR family regulator
MGQLENMQVFIRVVEAGGIGLAAKQLNIAKSAVSRRLVDLESHLGVTLLNRTTRTSNLTEAGNLYYTHALGIVNDVKELDTITSEPQTLPQGTLRLAAPLSFGLTHLAPALDTFIKEYPELTLHVDFSDQHIDLIEGGYDLAFRIGNLENSTLKARRITPINIVMCASPYYLDKWGTPENPSDLKHHQLLRYSLDDMNSWKLVDKRNKETIISIEAKILANNGDFLRDMAIAGHGILISPTFILSQALLKKDLLIVLPEYSIPSRNAYAVYPKTRYLSQRARLLIDYLLDKFGDNPYWDQCL